METPLQIAVCEDNASEAAWLVGLIEDSGMPSLCQVYACAEELLAAFSPGRFDLVFLDIYLTGMSGVEAAEKIRLEDETVLLAFTTSSSDHTLESYRLDALKYLEKPVTGAAVQKTLGLADMHRRSTAYITLPVEGEQRAIPLSGVLYFEQWDHAVRVNTTGGVLRTSQSVKLSHIEPRLPATFLRCHHSYIAHLRYVRGIDRELKVFVMQNGVMVHIRRQDFKKATESYEKYLFQRARSG